MTQDTPLEALPDEAGLALAYTPPAFRDALRVMLEFDARLSRIVTATTEPMLGQMRLAWWRETLGQPVDQRPQGDVVLDTIGREWAGHEAAIVGLVDGWEHMLADPPLSREAAIGFADGRGGAFAALANLAGASSAQSKASELAGRIWAVADAAAHIGNKAERGTLLEIGKGLGTPVSLGSPLKGVAVLGALARRSIMRGGLPLMDGRGAALTAMRAGLAGR